VVSSLDSVIPMPALIQRHDRMNCSESTTQAEYCRQTYFSAVADRKYQQVPICDGCKGSVPQPIWLSVRQTSQTEKLRCFASVGRHFKSEVSCTLHDAIQFCRTERFRPR